MLLFSAGSIILILKNYRNDYLCFNLIKCIIVCVGWFRQQRMSDSSFFGRHTKLIKITPIDGPFHFGPDTKFIEIDVAGKASDNENSCRN